MPGKECHLPYGWIYVAVMLTIGRRSGSRNSVSICPRHIVLPLKPRGFLVATAMQVFRRDTATRFGLGRVLLVTTFFDFPSVSRSFSAVAVHICITEEMFRVTNPFLLF
jgi:hypothetical protein